MESINGGIKVTELDLEDLNRVMSKSHPEYKDFIYFKMLEKEGARFFGFGFKNAWMKIWFLINLFFNKKLGGVMYFSRKM